jgi:2-oxoglutarate dehydrogenase E1 component
LGTIRDA